MAKGIKFPLDHIKKARVKCTMKYVSKVKTVGSEGPLALASGMCICEDLWLDICCLLPVYQYKHNPKGEPHEGFLICLEVYPRTVLGRLRGRRD